MQQLIQIYALIVGCPLKVSFLDYLTEELEDEPPFLCDVIIFRTCCIIVKAVKSMTFYRI